MFALAAAFAKTPISPTPWASFTSFANSGAGSPLWQNVGNAANSDDLYATWAAPPAGGGSDMLRASNPGAVLTDAIPVGAVINGVELRCETKYTGSLGASLFLGAILHQGGAPVSDFKIQSAWTYAADGFMVFGGPTSMWSIAWVRADFGAAFAVDLSLSAGGGSAGLVAHLDHVQARVYFT